MKKLFLLMMSVLLMSCKCPVSSYEEDGAFFVNVISWNLQTFFDATEEGSEYSQYKVASWTEEKYQKRVKTLCEFIRQTEADVYLFEEVENSAILQDISNELVALRSVKKGYTYSCFAKEPGDALGIAILSRFPLEDIQVHQINLQSSLGLNEFETSKDIQDGQDLEQPRLRSILHAKVCVNEEQSFSLYGCHWKSKYGGAEQSEVWRNAQEQLLATLLSKNPNKFLVAGDFNRTLEEFLADNDLAEDGIVILKGDQTDVSVYSPWLVYSSVLKTDGSYYFEETWEKIDHFFYSESLEVVDFQPIANETTLTAEGKPYRYSLYDGTGCSDHLPLQCVLEF